MTDSPQPSGEPMSRRALRDAEKRRPATGSSPGPAKPSGLSALIAKHPKAWLASALSVAFLLLGTGAVFAGVAVGSETVVAPTPTPSVTVVEPPRPVPSAPPASSRLRTCSVSALAADARLAQFSGYVLNATTGEALFDRAGTTPARSGSILKVLTAAAAVSTLGPDGQLSTRVIDGTAPGSIVLVGGGDPTLSVTPGSSFYTGAPSIHDLAEQARVNYEALHPGVPITEIILDATMWDPADKWDPSWLRKEQTIGYHSEVTALMVDGDRQNPSRSTSPRGTDPIAKAGAAFAASLGVDARISYGSAAAGRAVLGEVKSQPVRTLITQMLLTSDNTLAEMLARVVSKTMGFNGSAVSLAQAIPAAIQPFGVDTTGVVIRDGSGLSDLNSVAPAFIAQFMVLVLGGQQNLNLVYSGLSIAGKTGSLATRFTGSSADARGSVFAKTGWLDTEYSLGGIVAAADGTPLTFAFYAIRDRITEDAKTALDALTAGIFRCGDNLSNN